LSKINDKILLCEKYSSPHFSEFMTSEEMQEIKDNIPMYNAGFFGGYEDAERVMFGVFPDWEEFDENKYPITCIKITKTYPKELTHRDYLGSVLGLGIERSRVGDIKINGNDAYLFVCDDLAGFITGNLNKVGNCKVRCSIADKDGIDLPKQEYIEKSAVIASMRLDAVVAGACNVSRGQAVKLIQAKNVMLNHKECIDVSKEVKERDLISIRKHGRFFVEEVGGMTAKGRLHTIFKFYK